jgi:hypothetical protein
MVIVGQIHQKYAVTGLSLQSNFIMLPVMERGNRSCGTKKCHKFTTLVNAFKTMLVVLTALLELYCTPIRLRNGLTPAVGRSLTI